MVEEAVVGIDHDGARHFRPVERHHLAAEALLDPPRRDDRDLVVDGGFRGRQQGRVKILFIRREAVGAAEGVRLVDERLGLLGHRGAGGKPQRE